MPEEIKPGCEEFVAILVALQHLRLLLRFGLALRFGEGIDLRRSFHALFVVQQTFNRKKLDFGIILVVPELGLVTTGGGGSSNQFGFLKCDEDARRELLIKHVT